MRISNFAGYIGRIGGRNRVVQIEDFLLRFFEQLSQLAIFLLKGSERLVIDNRVTELKTFKSRVNITIGKENSNFNLPVVEIFESAGTFSPFSSAAFSMFISSFIIS